MTEKEHLCQFKHFKLSSIIIRRVFFFKAVIDTDGRYKILVLHTLRFNYVYGERKKKFFTLILYCFEKINYFSF